MSSDSCRRIPSLGHEEGQIFPAARIDETEPLVRHTLDCGFDHWISSRQAHHFNRLKVIGCERSRTRPATAVNDSATLVAITPDLERARL
jgi:hypothetical protein